MKSRNNNSPSRSAKLSGQNDTSAGHPPPEIRITTKERLSKVVVALFEFCSVLIGLPLIIFNELASWIHGFIGVNSNRLQGKVVLITGASSGIGESLAKYFYVAGCRVILAARRRNELERVRDSLTKTIVKNDRQTFVPTILELDISDLQAIPGKAATIISSHGKVDILVNNAGIFNRGTVVDTKMEVEQRVMQVNYFGTLALTKEVLREDMMKRKSGHVVFVSSILGKMNISHCLAYCASKHALQSLADSLRAEITQQGINVTIVSPSYVKTDISVNALTSTGETYGIVSDDIATGYSPEYVSERIFKAVANKEKDVIIAPLFHRAAMYTRIFMPVLYFYNVMRYGQRFE